MIQNFKTKQDAFDDLPGWAFVRASQLVNSSKRQNSAVPLPFSEPTLWRKVKLGEFPRPVKLGEKITAWRVEDVRSWLSAQEAKTQKASP